MRFQSGFNLSGEPADSHNVVVEQPVVEPQKPDDMRVSSEEESTDLPSIANRSRRPHTSKPTGRHKFFFTHFPKNPDCEVCELSKTSRAPCRGSAQKRRRL